MHATDHRAKFDTEARHKRQIANRRKLQIERLESRKLLSADPVLLHGPLPVDSVNIDPSGYFAHHDGRSGFELWHTDGTRAGTRLVKDIHPTGSSSPSDFFALGDRVYFTADDGEHGRELWVTDGSESGTVLIADIHAGPVGSLASPGPTWQRRMILFEDRLYFGAYDGVHGSELWLSDGTTEGTRLLKDIAVSGTSNLNDLSSGPYEFTIVGDELFFAVGSHDLGIWKTDGTEAGTVMVHATATGFYNSPGQLTEANDGMYFVSSLGRPWWLWKTDGTADGAVQLFDAGYDISEITPLDGRVAFVIGEAGVMIVTDSGDSQPLYPDPMIADHFSYPHHLREYGGDLFFVGAAQSWNRRTAVGLWKSDGSEAYATLFHDAPILSLVRTEQHLFFLTDSPNQQLWVTDGTEDGTKLVREFARSTRERGVTDLQSSGNVVTFQVVDHQDRKTVWQSDGTANGTRPFLELGELVSADANIIWNTEGTDLFLTDTSPYRGPDSHHITIFKNDGTPGGTEFVSTVPDTWYDVPQAVVGDIWFRVHHLRYLWRTDGTTEGSFNIPLPGEGFVGQITSTGDALYFLYDDQIWMSDGSVEGTVPVLDFGYASTVRLHANGQGKVYALIQRGSAVELWRNDKSQLTTLLTTTEWLRQGIVWTASDGDAVVLLDFQGQLDGWVLIRSDGTTAGTTVLAESDERAGSATIIARLGDTSLIRFQSPTGYELWATDGTAEGTQKLPGLSAAEYTALGSTGTKQVLGAFTATGVEIWATDGTPSGTERLHQFGSWAYLTRTDSTDTFVYFVAQLPGDELQLWATDGTSAGTRMVDRPVLYTAATSQQFFYVKGGRLWTINRDQSLTQLTEFPIRSDSLKTNGDKVLFLRRLESANELWESNGTTAGTRLVTRLPFDTYIELSRVEEGFAYISEGVRTWTVPLVEKSLELPAGGGEVSLRRDGDDLVVTLRGQLLFRGPRDTLGSLTIHGSSDQETYIVDYSGGPPTLAAGIAIVDGGDNRLYLRGGTAKDAHYHFADRSVLSIDGDRFLFSGVAGILDELEVAIRTFEFDASDNRVTLEGDQVRTGFSQLRWEDQTIRFANPTELLALDLGNGDDQLVMNRLGADFRSDIDVHRAYATGMTDNIELNGDWQLSARQAAFGSSFVEAVSNDVHVRLPTGPFGWHNPILRWDVNGDGILTPQDALIQINKINEAVPSRLPRPTPFSPFVFYDVNADGVFTSLDILTVVNQLNRTNGHRFDGLSQPVGVVASSPPGSTGSGNRSVDSNPSAESQQQDTPPVEVNHVHQHAALPVSTPAYANRRKAIDLPSDDLLALLANDRNAISR